MALTEIPIELSSTPSIVDGGNATAITIDSSENVTLAGNILHAGDLTLDVAGDIILDAGGADIKLNDDGTAVAEINLTGGNLILNCLTSDEDFLVKGNDGGSTIDALVLDMSARGAAIFNSTVTATGSTTNGSGPVDTLTIKNTGTSANDGPRIQFTSGTSTSGAAIASGGVAANSANLLFYAGGNTERMRIAANGSITMPDVYNDTTAAAANMHISSAGGLLFRSTSSARYKNTITDATHGLTELLTLRPVTYKGNNDGDTMFGGLIAEEVHDAGLTEFVQYNDEDEPDALAYGNMVSLCIKAIQEQQATIELQATAITDLTTRLTALENN